MEEIPQSARTSDVVLEHLVGDAVAHINLPAQNAAHRDQHFFRGFLFHDVAVRAGAERAFRIDRLIVHREDQHWQSRMSGADVFQQIESVGTIQRDIHDQNIGPGRSQHVDRTHRLFSFAADHEIGLPVDQQRQTLAHDGMVIDHQNSLLGDGLILRFRSARSCFSSFTRDRKRDWEQTDHQGSPGGNSLHFERTSAHPRPVVHQVKSHSFIAGDSVPDAAAVILNCKRTLMLVGGQSNHDLAGVSVLDRVVHRLPGNVVEMRSHSIVMDQHRA